MGLAAGRGHPQAVLTATALMSGRPLPTFVELIGPVADPTDSRFSRPMG